MGVAMPLLSADDEAWIRSAQQQSERATATWASDASRLSKVYGGQWVALLDGKVIAHAGAGPELRRQLDRVTDSDLAVVRFVPPEDWEFAF